MDGSLLVEYWYAHSVGHAIEGLRYALGYAAAKPDLKVSILLNVATPVELAADGGDRFRISTFGNVHEASLP